MLSSENLWSFEDQTLCTKRERERELRVHFLFTQNPFGMDAFKRKDTGLPPQQNNFRLSRRQKEKQSEVFEMINTSLCILQLTFF